MNKFVENKLPQLSSLFKDYGVKRAWLFGSSTTYTFGNESDIDILVDVNETIEPVKLGEQLWNLQFELESLFGRKVDLLTSRSLKNTFFIDEINKTKRLIYA